MWGKKLKAWLALWLWKIALEKTGLKQVRSGDEKAGCLTAGDSLWDGFTNVRWSLPILLGDRKVPGAKKPHAVFSKIILREPCATFAEDKCCYNSPCLANRLYHMSIFLGRAGLRWAVTLYMICEVFNLSQLQNIAPQRSKSSWNIETIHFAKVSSNCLIHREHKKGFSEIYSPVDDSRDKSETMDVQTF